MRQNTLDEAYIRILAELVSAKVEFVIVGGVAGVIHGVPLAPSDVDVVYRRTEENAQRLMTAIGKLRAKFYGDISDLMGRSDFHLFTVHGKLDLLTVIDGELSYGDLLPHSVELDVAGLRLNVLDLPIQITIKEALSRETDMVALPLLRAALKQRQHLPVRTSSG